MTTGLILLALLALAAGFFYTKARGKLKLPVSGKHWKGAIIVFVLLVLMFYASSHGQSGR
jgi:succinate dehydrogenase hydrophobic anchor subunit